MKEILKVFIPEIISLIALKKCSLIDLYLLNI